MEFSVALIIAAFAGGVFGAAIGGQPAFIFTGFMVMIGVANSLAGGDFDFLTNVAFGPVFGPHIAFAGGAAAAAYAAKRGVLESGRDIGTPLAGSGDPSVLIVGGLFGVGGALLQVALAAVLSVNGSADAPVPLTDSVALVVGISAIVARLMFGSTGLFGTLEEDARERGRLRPGGAQVWVEHQQGLLQVSVIGFGAGGLSAWAVTFFTAAGDQYATAAGILMFGVSAASLILLQFGLPGPVTHHMSLPAAVAAAGALSLGLGGSAALLVGAIGGVLGALLGEFYARLFLIHGDTHVDPPALAIATMATLVVIVRIIGGGI